MQTLQIVWRAVWMAFSLVILVIAVEICLQGKNHIFFRREHGESKIWRERMKVRWETMLKCWRMLLLPIPRVIGIAIFWRFIIFDNDIHFTEKFEVIATAAWIVVIGVAYDLIYSKALDIVLTRHQKMRDAIKVPDWIELSSEEPDQPATQQKIIKASDAFLTYVRLLDDHLSPLLRLLVIVLSVCLLGCFASLKYPDALCGTCCMASLSYLFVVLYMVLMEIDTSALGIFVNKNVSPFWEEVDVKAFRTEWRAEEQKRFREHAKGWDKKLFHNRGGTKEQSAQFIFDLLGRLKRSKGGKNFLS